MDQGPLNLPEHQSAQNISEGGSSQYQPTNEERQALKLQSRIFEAAKRYRKQYDENWLEYYKFFRGKQWSEQRPSYRHAEVVNFVFQTIQSQVPIITDSRPKFEFTPEEPSDRELAEILNEVAESDWQKYNWSYKLAECVLDSHIYGTGLAECFFDPKEDNGAGAIKFESRDIFYCFPSPKAANVNERACDFNYAEPVPVSQIKREYPDKGKFVKPDLEDLMRANKQDLDQVRFKSPVDQKTILEGGSAYEMAGSDECLKITTYLKDYEITEEEKRSLNPDGTEKVEYEQKLKYPNGRKIVSAGGVVLEDGPIEEEDGLFRFLRLINYIDPRSFWGISEVEQIKSPQKIFNKLISFALDVLTLMGNPIWVVDDTSGIDTDNLFNRPGLILEKTAGSEVRREEGVQLQPYVMQIASQIQQWIDSVSGSQEVSRGVKPEGVTAMGAIQSLQEAAQTRLRLKSRNLDAFLQDFGQMYRSRVFQYYSSPRIIRVTNNQNAQKYFKFHIDTMEDGTKVANVRHWNGQGWDVEAKQYQVRGKLDVRVNTGSTLPFVKDQKTNLAFKLYEGEAIPRKELLKAVEWPNWEQVEEEMAAKEQADMEAEMMAQGGPPPGPGGAGALPPASPPPGPPPVPQAA